jgi:hypothetical protein
MCKSDDEAALAAREDAEDLAAFAARDAEASITFEEFIMQLTDGEARSVSINPDFLSLIKKSRACQTREGGISSEEMRRRLDVPSEPNPNSTKPKRRRRP